MLDILQYGAIREAVLLIATRQAIHGDIANGDLAQKLAKQVCTIVASLCRNHFMSNILCCVYLCLCTFCILGAFNAYQLSLTLKRNFYNVNFAEIFVYPFFSCRIV